MKYSKTDINSAIGAALRLSQSDGRLRNVFATAYGYVVTTKKPPFNQDGFSTNGSKVWKYTWNFLKGEREFELL